MAETFNVSLDMLMAMDVIDKAVVEKSWTGERIDHYIVPVPGAGSFVQLVYEKHYIRAGNHLVLMVTLDDITGQTRVHCVAGGRGSGIWDDELGAAESFEVVVLAALAQWRV